MKIYLKLYYINNLLYFLLIYKLNYLDISIKIKNVYYRYNINDDYIIIKFNLISIIINFNFNYHIHYTTYKIIILLKYTTCLIIKIYTFKYSMLITHIS